MNANTNFIFEDHRGELGACQVGKAADVISCDEKYFDDRLVTLPMLAAINPDKTNDLCTVGFLVMGKFLYLLLWIHLLICDCTQG